MSRRLAVMHSLTSTWCPCSYSRHWQKLSPLLWTKWHRLPLSLPPGGIICFHIFLSSLISDLITIPNWEDLLDDDVNRKPIWWQGFWKMMQNSGFQALNMSWNVLKCSELSFQELDKPLSSSNTATRLLAWAWPSNTIPPRFISNPIFLTNEIVPRLLSRWKIGWMESLSTSTGSTSPGLGLSTGLLRLFGA